MGTQVPGWRAVLVHGASISAALLLAAMPASGQAFESVGVRALGMAGAFVAVADDATATYWNPAGLATGGLIDACAAYASQRWPSDGQGAPGSAYATAASSVCVAIPAFGFSYNRLRASQVVNPAAPTGTVPGDRQDLRLRVAGVSMLDTRQFGATFVQSLPAGFTVGATVKWVRGRAASDLEPAELPRSELLARAADLPGRVSHAFDADLGVMVNAGPLRAGLTVRNLFEPGFETETGDTLRLHRQARVGVALTPGVEAATHVAEDSWVVALDADLSRTPTAAGDRRMVAAGVERWLGGRRVGLRGGLRANTAGPARPVAAAGISAGVTRGVWLEAFGALGGADADSGWGIGARFGF